MECDKTKDIDLFGNEIAARVRRGGGKAMFRIIGASNHCENERAAEDYYATPPEAVEMLCDMESFSTRILEPCCGGGHIARVLEGRGYTVVGRDLVNRGYGEEHGVDFLEDQRKFDGDIVTNPPYSLAREFVEHSIESIPEGNKVAMFLKLTFLEGKARRKMFEKSPPRTVYVSSSRLTCGKNGTEWGGGVVCYAWFVWQKGWRGDPVIKWFN